MANRFIIGKGELLTYDIDPPPIRPTKAHPYTLEQAQQILIPQITVAAAELSMLPRRRRPNHLPGHAQARKIPARAHTVAEWRDRRQSEDHGDVLLRQPG